MPFVAVTISMYGRLVDLSFVNDRFSLARGLAIIFSITKMHYCMVCLEACADETVALLDSVCSKA